jgi:hypothetical protein
MSDECGKRESWTSRVGPISRQNPIASVGKRSMRMGQPSPGDLAVGGTSLGLRPSHSSGGPLTAPFVSSTNADIRNALEQYPSGRLGAIARDSDPGTSSTSPTRLDSRGDVGPMSRPWRIRRRVRSSAALVSSRSSTQRIGWSSTPSTPRTRTSICHGHGASRCIPECRCSPSVRLSPTTNCATSFAASSRSTVYSSRRTRQTIVTPSLRTSGCA